MNYENNAGGTKVHVNYEAPHGNNQDSHLNTEYQTGHGQGEQQYHIEEHTQKNETQYKFQFEDHNKADPTKQFQVEYHAHAGELQYKVEYKGTDGQNYQYDYHRNKDGKVEVHTNCHDNCQLPDGAAGGSFGTGFANGPGATAGGNAGSGSGSGW